MVNIKSTCRKPKLLIIGHARHGKDTLAEKIKEQMGFSFTSSSVFAAKEAIWATWGSKRYNSFDDMVTDRVNHRKTWADMISTYNTPDKTRMAKKMLEQGYDMYVGMRRRDEFNACQGAKLFDHVIWVDGLKRLPPENIDSMELNANDADIYFDNNGSTDSVSYFVRDIQTYLHERGYDVGLNKTVNKILEVQS